MGHFTHNCKLTGVPIKDKAVLIVMKPSGKLYDNSEKSIKQYGKTYMCSNDGTRMKFIPVWYPLKGQYDDYGRLEKIEEGENTRIIEEYYGLKIEQIVNIICSGRKDDGYDDSLEVIKEPYPYPEDWIEGEKHIEYYSRTQNDPHPYGGRNPWSIYGGTDKEKFLHQDENMEAQYITKEEYEPINELTNAHYKRYNDWKDDEKNPNPDPKRDYGSPQYKERYKELLTYSGMWVHGEVYDKLANKKTQDNYDKIDLGVPQLLETLGFEHKGEDKSKERYNQIWTKDGLTIHSDGTWINVPNEHIYHLPGFKEFCKKNGVDIDVEQINQWSRVEQTCRLVIPKMEIPLSRDERNAKLVEVKVAIKSKEVQDAMGEDGLDEEQLLQYMKYSMSGLDQDTSGVLYYLLNGNYTEYEIKNPLSVEYMRAVQKGLMIDEIAAFWAFDKYMYAMGAYYEIVGTGPQDGEFKMVKDVLDIASQVVNEYVEEYESEYEE